MIEYKERRRIVDEMKDELQNKITEYSKLVESGMCFLFYTGVYSIYVYIYILFYIALYNKQ